MSDFKTYRVAEIDGNDYMVWHVCSQAASLAKIQLKDDRKTYFTAEKKNSSTALQELTPGGQGDFYSGAPNLRIEITVDYPGVDIKGHPASYSIVNTRGLVVGHGWNLAIEDLNDEDYNDYYINIVAWKKKG